MPRLEIPGVADRAAVRRTADTIVAAQGHDGAIPWYRGGQLDPWDHVHAAMGLDAAGRHRAAARALTWAAERQRRDGSLAVRYRFGRVDEPAGDASATCYLATGVWHHTLATGDTGLAQRLWPAIRRGVGFALGLQRPGGEIAWVRCPDGRPWPEALLTGNASLYLSIRCALALADLVAAEPQPDWELAVGRVGHALRTHEDRFGDRSRYSMDWYYPVLGTALRGSDARARLDAGAERFVVDGLGIRCVADRPWVTGAETCELALALAATGRVDAAVEAITSVQHLRDRHGAYWTGLVYPDHARWPVERTTWTAATVLLAADAVADGPARSLFRGDGLPLGVHPEDVTCEHDACVATPAR